MTLIIKDFDSLVQHIKQVKPRIITLDGRDGSGKTYLSKKLHKEISGTLLSENTYRSASLEGLFEFDRIKFLEDLGKSLKNRPVIFESCYMLSILRQAGLQPDMTVYIKAISSSTGGWSDEDELDEEPTKKLALQKEISFGKTISIPPSNFRLQMIEYHYDFKPHENSDVIYERIEIYKD